MHSNRIPDIKRDGRPDAELRTCLVNLNVTSRAELICLQEGNDASFTNCSERKGQRQIRAGRKRDYPDVTLRDNVFGYFRVYVRRLRQRRISRDEEKLAHVASVNTKDTGP